jgi:hypothetical protein
MTSLILWFLILPGGKRPVRRYGPVAELNALTSTHSAVNDTLHR